jgi:hypothetical protein
MGRTADGGEVHAIKCWKCGSCFYINSYDGILLEDEDMDAVLCDGVVDPNFPANMLQTLVDAAMEQMEDLKMRVRSTDDDPEIVDMVLEIEESVNRVRDFLADGTLPEYTPPR